MAAQNPARRAVINLRDSRPVWRIPESIAHRIARAFPSDWQVVAVAADTDGRGDGSGVTEEALDAARGAEVWIGYGIPREIFLAASPCLRWAHTGTAGVASLLYPEMMDADVVLTNSAGVHAPAMAESVIAMALHFARGFDHAVRAQHAREWNTRPFDQGITRELDGATLGIIGLGGIGHEVAQRARALGMRILATRRSKKPGPEGVEVLHGDHALDRLLARSDFVLIAIPATRETRGLLDASRIARLQPHAVLINVARGDVLDEDALIHALREQRIRGAALDVFRSEPLPPDSPLWSLPGVLITPHVSATTPRFWERESNLVLDNIARYLARQPLRNVVDKRSGY